MAELWGQPVKLAREETRLALVDDLLHKFLNRSAGHLSINTVSL